LARKSKLARKSHERYFSFIVALVLVMAAGWSIRATRVLGQEKEVHNPVTRDPKTIELGKAYFRARCGYCHGLDAQGGGQGPNLTLGGETHLASDAAFYRTITEGIAGTGMPGTDLSDNQAWAIIAFVRSQSGASRTPVRGDLQQGKAVFFGKGNCASCHMVNGQGGRLGPDLSRVGASRSLQYLTDSIREPSKDLTEGLQQLDALIPAPVVYDTVIVTTRDGQHITGVAKNEDNFSLQLMDVGGEIRLFMKKDLAEVVHERKSLMPAYDESMLSPIELQDLLRYLQSLCGSEARANESEKVPPAKAAVK
jgi:putative heme-binding domain-containing protein